MTKTSTAGSLQRPVILSLLILGIVWQIVVQLPHSLHPGMNSWGLTDWLINYSGGFVRRGFTGNLLWWASDTTGLHGHHLAIAVSLATYALLLAWLLRHTRNDFSPALILSCLLLAFPAFQHAIIRKDCLLALCLIACVRLLTSDRNPPIKWLGINLIAIPAIFSHEAFAFFALPALALCDHARLGEGVIRRTLYLAPSFLCFGLTLWQHGSPDVALAIHQSWLPLWQHACLPGTQCSEPFSTIQSLGWSAADGMSMARGVLDAGLYQPVAWLAVTGISFLLVVAHVRTANATRHRCRMLCLLGFQLLAVSPLYLVGIDYGRWLFLCILGSVILFSTGFTAPFVGKASAVAERTPDILTRILDQIRRQEVLLLVFGIPILWSIRNFLTASPVGRLLESIWVFQAGR